MKRYDGLFAASDEDLGRTDVVKHPIETGNARPIKQPLRRVPDNLGPEVDRRVEDMLERGVIQNHQVHGAQVSCSSKRKMVPHVF